jgi:hypothetical protein
VNIQTVLKFCIIFINFYPFKVCLLLCRFLCAYVKQININTIKNTNKYKIACMLWISKNNQHLNPRLACSLNRVKNKMINVLDMQFLHVLITKLFFSKICQMCEFIHKYSKYIFQSPLHILLLKKKCQLLLRNNFVSVWFYRIPSHYRSYSDFQVLLVEEDLRCLSINYFRHKWALE